MAVPRTKAVLNSLSDAWKVKDYLHIRDVCKTFAADSAMPDSEKVAHILKGIRDDALYLLIRNIAPQWRHSWNIAMVWGTQMSRTVHHIMQLLTWHALNQARIWLRYQARKWHRTCWLHRRAYKNITGRNLCFRQSLCSDFFNEHNLPKRPQKVSQCKGKIGKLWLPWISSLWRPYLCEEFLANFHSEWRPSTYLCLQCYRAHINS